MQVIRSRALGTSGQALEVQRRQVNYFVSYARTDEVACRELVERLKQQMGPSRKYQHALWADWQILVGEAWRQQIAEALGQCDFGLLLMSPSFLSSQFIGATELPYFVSNAKPLIPVVLAPVNAGRHDLKGLDESQLFSWQTRPGAPKLSFDDCDDHRKKRRFAEALFAQIEERLDRHYADFSE
jgi:hypothetical protein